MSANTSDRPANKANMSANASDRPANKAEEKAVVEKGLGKKHGQYFIFMVASDAVNSFVLVHES